MRHCLARIALTFLLANTLITQHAEAVEWEPNGKLPLTRGISTIDGVAGGGIVPWALIAGNETNRGVGFSAHYSRVNTSDYSVDAFGGSIGWKDKIEVSYTNQTLDTEQVGTALGLGHGFELGIHSIGAKVRIVGDAVYDQDRWLPQVAIGAVYKQSNQKDLVLALGAESASGLELYISATKVFLKESVLVNVGLRYTDANQNGLIGFGGSSNASVYPEVSVGYLINRRIVVGVEGRKKPDNLGFAKEEGWYDAFVAIALDDQVTLAAAYVDLGSIATFDNQTGFYISLQMGF